MREGEIRQLLQGPLRRIGLPGLLGLAPKQTVTQQLDLLFQVEDLSLIRLGCLLLKIECLKQPLLEQNRIIKKVIGQRNLGPDDTGSRHVGRRQNLMRTVAP